MNSIEIKEENVKILNEAIKSNSSVEDKISALRKIYSDRYVNYLLVNIMVVEKTNWETEIELEKRI